MQSSIWFQTLRAEDQKLLGRADALPRSAEVAIVGAGAIGLMAAHYLLEAGFRDICVLERHAAFCEASGASAGGVWFGQECADLGPLIPLAQASNALYEELHGEPGFDFDFRRTGVVELLAGGKEEEAGRRIASARDAGFRAERIASADLGRIEPALAAGGVDALFYPDDAVLNPARLAVSLVRRLRERKVRLCFQTEVVEAGPRIRTSRGDLDAGAVILATGAWTPLLTRALGWAAPIKPVRGQLLATTPLGPVLRHIVVGRQFYYWQLSEGHVAGGGTMEDVAFERGVRTEDLASIRAEMDELIPPVRGVETACAWSGFRPFCADMMPAVGRVPGQERIWVAAGHFRKGIVLAPATGKMIAGLLASGRSDLPAGMLAPDRFASS